jgi:putative ABC transport system substrate-binding protein
VNRRRAIRALAVLGSAAVLPWANAQAPGRVPRVAILMFGSTANFKSRADAFRKGMAGLGYVDEKTVHYEWCTANGQSDLLQKEANKIAREGYDVIVSASTVTTRALHNATSTIPVVMVAVDDPVANGFARSLARPETNFTGLTASVVDQAPKVVELLSSAVPKRTRFAALANPANTTYRAYCASLQAAIRNAGARLTIMDATTPQQAESAFAAIGLDRVDGVIVMGDSVFYTDRAHITELAASAQRPAIYPHRGYVEAGGLMSYGPNLEHNFVRAADYVDRILKGANPRELSIEQHSKHELYVNRNTARVLGLSLPPDLLKKADRVIG